eukprot:TRINITY_DN2834_c0_g1_i3.p1 TRINITY_DN2834_c0_g1~~TRINITY_DN2834_c0_g1_i3.p1  ORF type:complete len:523 (-),score=113.47 TRINITY_DN2834_c0_g1_i3:96-1664(-)
MNKIVKLLLSVFFFTLYKILDVFQYLFRSARSIKNQEKFLSNNFAPVHNEFFRQGLLIAEGRIPSDLNGELVRNGPNPRKVALGGYHWFDGDGMLHGVRIKDGSVSYVNRYVKTSRFEPLFFHAGVGELWGIFAILKVILTIFAEKFGLHKDFKDQTGSANTALVFHAKKFFALVESHKPTLVKILEDGELETIGVYSYNGNLKHNFTAHPKIDANTGEMMTFGYKFIGGAFLTYSVISKEGEVVRTFPIPLKRPVMMHDMAITTNYSIFFDFPVVFDQRGFLKNRSTVTFDKEYGSRIGILPRHAPDASTIRWFTVDTCYMFHSVNAWEEGDVVVISGCRSHTFQISNLGGGWIDSKLSPEDNVYKAVLYEWRINTKTGEVEEHQILADYFVEFPTIDYNLTGVKNQFCYLPYSTVSGLDTGFEGVIKYDLFSRRVVGMIKYPRNGLSGEAVFVPRENAKTEDDGYLLTFVYYEQSDSSQFVVMDAKTMSNKFLTAVDLPQRVPFGFHGLWVSEQDLASQQ